MAVGLRQGVADLDAVFQRLRQRERAIVQTIRQCSPFQVLHNEEGRPILFAHVVKRADVWMAESGNAACFLEEALATGTFVGPEYLDGDSPIEACVPRAVDLAHATGAEYGDDLE